MTAEDLKKIVDAHRLWLNGDPGGIRADLSEADLRRADLSGANLSEADLNFSCLPLWCGGLGWKIDKRIAAQLAYHFCSMECDDPDFIRIRNGMLDFANRFHLVVIGSVPALGEAEAKE
jgi:uncharacterized protein YjbI with pentapeptide repeats